MRQWVRMGRASAFRGARYTRPSGSVVGRRFAAGVNPAPSFSRGQRRESVVYTTKRVSKGEAPKKCNGHAGPRPRPPRSLSRQGAAAQYGKGRNTSTQPRVGGSGELVTLEPHGRAETCIYIYIYIFRAMAGVLNKRPESQIDHPTKVSLENDYL